MKNRICAALLPAVLAAALLAGCNAREAAIALERAEEQLDRLEEQAERAVSPVTVDEPKVPAAQLPDVPAVSAAPKGDQPAEEKSGFISPEEAKNAALAHAGFTADQVESLRAEFDVDDRVPLYDVEFRQAQWEYDYEIHAETGNVLAFEKDT